jgi:Methyltransferase domain
MQYADFTKYRLYGHRRVSGYTEHSVYTLLTALDDAQQRLDVDGSVAEIGVHHGQLFIALNLLQRPGRRAVAIDVFDDQELNIDHSGEGDLGAFRRNVDRWGRPDDVVIHQGDSTKVTSEELLGLADKRVRLFSVDGGHTAGIVHSDMKLADAVLADGGIIIADDVFNEQWPGVAVGTLRYMDKGWLVPFCLGFNKTLFAAPDWASLYRKSIGEFYRTKALTVVRESLFENHEVSILVSVPKRLDHMARRSQFAKRVYHRLRK